MRISVDVRKVVQEIDLDTGITTNFLIFTLGSAEHRVEASDRQIQEAIVEASMQLEGQPEYKETAPVARPTIGAVGEMPGDFVDELLEAPMHAQDDNPFVDVNLPVTEEEMAQFQTGGASVLPMNIDLSDDEEPVFEEINGREEARLDAPLSPSKQRQANIKQRHEAGVPPSRQQTITALRAKAKQRPPRRLAPHQVDEAGNPMVPQAQQPRPRPPPMQGEQEVHITTGPPPGDDDGFEQG